MQYTDCAIESLSGLYNRDLNRIGDHVHPVIAALFLPKFRVVDDFFLWSNIAGIVKSRYNKEIAGSAEQLNAQIEHLKKVIEQGKKNVKRKKRKDS